MKKYLAILSSVALLLLGGIFYDLIDFEGAARGTFSDPFNEFMFDADDGEFLSDPSPLPRFSAPGKADPKHRDLLPLLPTSDFGLNVLSSENDHREPVSLFVKTFYDSEDASGPVPQPSALSLPPSGASNSSYGLGAWYFSGGIGSGIGGGDENPESEPDGQNRLPDEALPIDENHGPGGEGKDYAATPVPEPATILLIGSGLLGLAGTGRKLRRARSS